MNIWQIEQAYMERLRPQLGTLRLVGTFDDLDWTGEAAPRVGVQVVYDGLQVADEAAAHALVGVAFTAHVCVDVKRASAADRTVAADALLACTRAALGWEQPNFRVARLENGQRTSFDGRLLRVSISFVVPAFAAALAGA
jgi:hypothetical protein